MVAATVLTVFDAAPSTRAGPYASGGFSAGPFLSCAPSFYEDSSGNCIEDLISTRTATLVSAAMALARTRGATAVHVPAMGSCVSGFYRLDIRVIRAAISQGEGPRGSPVSV